MLRRFLMGIELLFGALLVVLVLWMLAKMVKVVLFIGAVVALIYFAPTIAGLLS